MKLLRWLRANLGFKINNRWKDWKSKSEIFIIWFGSRIQSGDIFNHYVDSYKEIEVTMFNIGFIVTLSAHDIKLKYAIGQ